MALAAFAAAWIAVSVTGTAEARPGFRPTAATSRPASFKGPWILLPGISHKNLTVFPITLMENYRPPVSGSGYITLDEGLKAGTVEVSEMAANPPPLIRNRPPGGSGVRGSGGSAGIGFDEPLEQQTSQSLGGQQQSAQAGQTRQTLQQGGGAQVNKLMLFNRSGKKLILLSGEMVVGGKQDRIVQKDALIPPGKDPIPMDVFCVEQGRWHGQQASFAPAPNVAAGATGALADPTVRGAAQGGGGQGRVWEEVDAKNRKASAQTSSNTYQATLNSQKAKAEAASYVQAMERAFPRQKAVGAVVAVNGRLVWVDCFVDSGLFYRYWPKLVQSYVVEAVTEAPAPIRGGPVVKVPSIDEAMAFLYDQSGKSSFEGEEGVYRLNRIEGAKHVLLQLIDLGVPNSAMLHLNKMLRK